MAEKHLVKVNDYGTYWYAWPGTERKLHRLDGPAIEYSDGGREWYQNGRLHRVDGPAVERPNGYRAWWQTGRLHRLDGPAIVYSDGNREWYQNGQVHRLDGPAVINEDGTKEYWINGTQHTEESWRAATQPAVELSIEEIEAALGKRIKVVK